MSSHYDLYYKKITSNLVSLAFKKCTEMVRDRSLAILLGVTLWLVSLTFNSIRLLRTIQANSLNVIRTIKLNGPQNNRQQMQNM